MKFLGVHWGLRLRRTDQRLAISPLLMLPSAHLNCVGVLIASFRSSIPSPPIPLFTLRCAPRGVTTQNSGRVDRYSFLVGILPPLLHTGLARRTEIQFHAEDSPHLSCNRLVSGITCESDRPTASVPIENCLNEGVHPRSVCPKCAQRDVTGRIRTSPNMTPGLRKPLQMQAKEGLRKRRGRSQNPPRFELGATFVQR